MNLPLRRLAACCLLLAGSNDLSASDAPPTFTRLAPLPLSIIAAADEFRTGGYSAENMLRLSGPDGNREYASNGLAEQTFVDFDLGKAHVLTAFRHIQRSTMDTVATADLIFSDTPDFSHIVSTVSIQHVNDPSATTFAVFPPVRARYVRWQVTSVTPGRPRNVGGRGIEFFSAQSTTATPSEMTIETRSVPILRQEAAGVSQPLELTLDYPYAESAEAVLQVADQPPKQVLLSFGRQTQRFHVPAVDEPREIPIRVAIGKQEAVSHMVSLPPARRLTVYLLPHSHTDIGYTGIQTDIEEKQIDNLQQGLAAARRTADYPEGARFVWNVEVLWAADLFLERLSSQDQDEFFDAIRQGQVALEGMYLNELTGLCRPEELTRLFHLATKLSKRTEVPIESAMISDVPGYTWGLVTAMNQAGIRYFSVAPNYFDRIGTILVEWENKPFWWIGPDGKSKVLVWIPFWGYAMSHRYREMSPRLVEDFCAGLDSRDYPYDIAYARWSGYGDNAVPDPSICEFVKAWNAEHVSPRFIISSTSAAFRAFEQRYGDQLPEVRGDWTPYWEDGAGSSAAETALNRASSERLSQAEAIWAMRDPSTYPADKFEQAWKNVLLYSEHTWGAHCSISQPAIRFTAEQWNIKQSFATTANLQSRQLLSEAAQASRRALPNQPETYVDVFNTTSWPRSELVFVSNEIAAGCNSATDSQGRALPSQPVSNQELAVLLHELPPYSGQRLTLSRKPSVAPAGWVKAAGTVLENDRLRLRVDEMTGGIVELRLRDLDVNLVDTSNGRALNEYLYLIGDDTADVQRNGSVTITVRESGPLVASLVIKSEAPGCHQLCRELRLVAGADHVELIDTVDKRRLEATSYHAEDGKESVNFAFPFNVPDGQLRLDVPYGVIRPELDQMPSACKNWLTVGRWADVSNSDFGVTWVTLDAPLVQVGGLTATLLNSQTDPSVWRKTIDPTQELISWAMNNHWGTNYRAYQEGPVIFRYVLRPHRGSYNDGDATRLATNFSQPLVALPGRGTPPRETPLVEVNSDDVVISSLKPSDDRKAIIVRLLGVGKEATDVTLNWPNRAPRQVFLSDTGENRLTATGDTIEVPAWGLVTVRAEFDE